MMRIAGNHVKPDVASRRQSIRRSLPKSAKGSNQSRKPVCPIDFFSTTHDPPMPSRRL